MGRFLNGFYLCATSVLLLSLFWAMRSQGGEDEAIPFAARVPVPDLRTGDLILRRGRDVTSAIVLASDPSSRFSHVGITTLLGKLPAVVHVLPRESSHPGGTVLIETVADFVAPENASEFAVYRMREPTGGIPDRAGSVALRYFKERRPFDQSFDLETEARLYCSELVWRAFLEAGADLVDGRLQKLSLPLKTGNFVLPGSFTRSPHLQQIYSSGREER